MRFSNSDNLFRNSCASGFFCSSGFARIACLVSNCFAYSVSSIQFSSSFSFVVGGRLSTCFFTSLSVWAASFGDILFLAFSNISAVFIFFSSFFTSSSILF
jgi:hypothetical protein